MTTTPKIVALCGGVGGAKLALGLASLESQPDISIVVNTGDDFNHLGLTICPDIDTVTYTLAGIANPDSGWGRAQETWSFMEALEALGGDTWFRLGDKDLALNTLRTQLLASGWSLSDVTSQFAHRLGVATEIIPMSDDPVRTILKTENGDLAFQDYFVRLKCEPAVSSIEFRGAESAAPAPRFAALLEDTSVDAFVICPSNPFISIEPILAIPSVRESLTRHAAPVICVSPVVGGQSIKGPTSKLMKELNMGASTWDIARYYGDFIDCFVIDEAD
ncbi:MAG: 2-phospho-L-lactate transferase, partial [Pseudomonadota bacterium]